MRVNEKTDTMLLPTIPEPMKSACPSLLHPVLIVVAAADATSALVAECEACPDLWVLRVTSLSAALRVLHASHVSAVVAGPDLDALEVSTLLATLAQLQPRVPALVVRARPDDRLDAWKSHRVAVLAYPVPVGLLPRALSAALGLRQIRSRAN
jgi:hypothetical protein